MLDNLSAFDERTRREALATLAQSTAFPPESAIVNMHLHTFFSYNGEGWSPARLAFEMKKHGVHAAAICDFDVLHGLDEFLDASDLLQLRSAVAFETRTFFHDYAAVEINSPGEPGVFYFMGMGFVKQPIGKEAEGFQKLLTRSHERNRAVIARINRVLSDFQLNYENDVLPLTPAKNATERHICVALHQKAIAVLGSPEEAALSWAKTLDLPAEEVGKLITNANAFTDLLRSKLIKKGGPGYVQPDKDTFPPLEEVIELILNCRAIPMTAWLDGSLPGEHNPEQQLERLQNKGVAAVNIIPDRNWNFKDPEKKAEKVRELNRYIEAARKLSLPVNVGTEANKPGQRLLDDFESDALAPHRQTFVTGADIIVGHTRLLRYANMSYTDKHLDFASTAAKNDFFAAVGALPEPSRDLRETLLGSTNEQSLAILADAARKGNWNR